jgi:hypothetical protein
MPGSAAVFPSATSVSTVLTHKARLEAGSHLAILQLLDREIGGVEFPAEQFEPTVSDWDGIPIIFADEHPDLDAYDEDPEAELERIGGRRLGPVRDPALEIAGHPRLMGHLDFGGDAEVEHLCEDGTLSLSTAFRARVQAGAVTSPPAPHHVLVFEEKAGVSMPRDPGAVILNKTGAPMDALTQAGKVVSTGNTGKLRSILKGFVSLFKEMTGEDLEPEDESPKEQKNRIDTGATPIDLSLSLEARKDRIREALTRLINPRWSDGTPGWLDIIATFPESVIFRYCCGDDATYQVPYTLENGAYSFGEPIPVEETFVPTADEDQAAPVRNTEGADQMNKPDYERELALANKQAADRLDEITNRDKEIADLRVQLTNKDQELTNRDAELTTLKTRLAEFRQKQEDADFEQFLQMVQPAFYEKPEDRQALRTEFTNNLSGLMKRLPSMLIDRSGVTGTTGHQQVGVMNTEARSSTVGGLDPKTGGYS